MDQTVGKTADQTAEPLLVGALDALWARFLPDIMSRVENLESAVQGCRSNSLSAQQRDDAHSAAHKLAGVLGTFGLTRGTELARELETSFAPEATQLPVEQLAAIASELRSIIAGRK
jgi:HPt (histidine-containing phosphotransfer) domain-containing protein